MRLADIEKFDQEQREANRREAVDNVFSERLMLFLSILMIPTLIIPILFSLPEPLNSILNSFSIT